jgi:hypothetical protein
LEVGSHALCFVSLYPSVTILFNNAGAKVLGADSDNAFGSIARQIRTSVSSMIISEDP